MSFTLLQSFFANPRTTLTFAELFPGSEKSHPYFVIPYCHSAKTPGYYFVTVKNNSDWPELDACECRTMPCSSHFPGNKTPPRRESGRWNMQQNNNFAIRY